MAASNETALPVGGAALRHPYGLPHSLDQVEGRHYGSLAASLALHFLILMGLWGSQRTPKPPEPSLVEVEIIQTEPIRTASKRVPSKQGKLSDRVAKQKQPKIRQQKQANQQPPEPEVKDYEMDAQVVKAGKRAGKTHRQVAKIALPDVSQPIAISGRDALKPGAEQTAGASLQQSEQRGTLKPRLSSVGQQASSRMQLQPRAGVESEDGPKLIASNAPSAQTLAPEYRHSARPGGAYSSAGGAAQTAMGGGPASEAAQAYSLQSSSLAGSPAGNPAALSRSANNAQSGTPSGRAGLSSNPGTVGVARSGSASPTEISSSGGQGQVAASGAPINPLNINSSGGSGKDKAAAGTGGAGNNTYGDNSKPGGGSGGGRGLDEGGSGQLVASQSGGRSVGPSSGGMAAAIVPDGSGGSGTSGVSESAGSGALQQVQAQGAAHVIEERYAAKELKVQSPHSVCQLPLMLAGFDRKPMPEGLASIMGSESAMVMEAPPVLLPGNIQPTYPASAVFSRAQGRAVVRAQVLPTGKIGEAFIRQSTGNQTLDQAAIATVRGWRFQPARRNGQPVQSWVNIPIEYRNPS